MQNAAPVNLRQVRDLGEIITTTFTFLKQNKGPLFRALATTCLPPVLLGGFLVGRALGAFQKSVFGFGRLDMEGPGISAGGWMLAGLGYVAMLLFMIVAIAMVNEYIRAYHLGQQHTVTTKDLWNSAWSEFGSYFGAGFLSGLLIFIGLILCVLPGLYVGTVLSLVFICHAIERTGATGSMARSNQLVKDRFWETLGLVIVIYLINMVINYVLMLPFTIIGFAMGMNSMMDAVTGNTPEPMSGYSLLMAVQMSVQMAVSILTYPIISVCMGLKYFSLVEEKEAAGLRNKLEGFEQA